MSVAMARNIWRGLRSGLVNRDLGALQSRNTILWTDPTRVNVNRVRELPVAYMMDGCSKPLRVIGNATAPLCSFLLLGGFVLAVRSAPAFTDRVRAGH